MRVRRRAPDARDGAALLLALILSIGGCDATPPDREPAAPLRALPETTMIPVAPPPRLTARDSLPARIFYDLTRYDWYAHGEPLRWADHDWQPRGVPVALETEQLRHVGEYEGVDLWVRADEDPVTRVYVPVSEGYWLPFAVEEGSGP